MGCSMGGRVVVRLARERGERLRAVVGLEGSDHPTPWYDDSWLDRPEFLRGDFCAALVSGLVAPQSPDVFRWETLWHYCQSGPEVFRGDMELANGYVELTDAVEQRRRIDADLDKRRRLGRDVNPWDRALIAALEHGLPECAGVAVGVERLHMCLENSDDIRRVMTCAFEKHDD